MDEWNANEPKALDYDFNLCTVREFCEVFGLDPSVARGLLEYREDVLFVFKFEKLLKLKGITQELLRQWCESKPGESVNTDFQTALGLQTRTREPIPGLLEAVCGKTGAQGCLMAARDGGMLFRAAANGNGPSISFETVAPEIPKLLRPLQDALIEMDLRIPDMQVLGFDSHDLLFQVTGGFYIAAIQPKGSLNAGSLGLWRAFAAEVRRRHPLRVIIESHAKAAENELRFACPHCSLGIVVGIEYAGASFDCPKCKKPVTVPEPAADDPAAAVAQPA